MREKRTLALSYGRNQERLNEVYIYIHKEIYTHHKCVPSHAETNGNEFCQSNYNINNNNGYTLLSAYCVPLTCMVLLNLLKQFSVVAAVIFTRIREFS